jgi:hypothetical protein
MVINQRGDQYCGFKSWLIVILCCPLTPCIYLSPLDDMPASSAAPVVTKQWMTDNDSS